MNDINKLVIFCIIILSLFSAAIVVGGKNKLYLFDESPGPMGSQRKSGVITVSNEPSVDSWWGTLSSEGVDYKFQDNITRPVGSPICFDCCGGDLATDPGYATIAHPQMVGQIPQC